MGDNDPRLDVLRQWLPTMPTPSRPVLLRRLDHADLERGIVRVDTNDEALRDRLWGDIEELLVARDYRPAPSEVVDTLMDALREATR